MTLLVYDVITVRGEAPATLDVVWVSGDDGSTALLDRSDPNAWPVLVDMEQVRRELGCGAWTVSEGRPPNHRLDHELSETDRSRRDENYEVVRAMVDGHVPGIFVKAIRAKRVTFAQSAFDRSRPTVTGLLRRYLWGGMSKGALTSGYANCGAPGRPRPAAEGAVKRGRPPTPGRPPGINVTDDLRRVFALAIDMSYARKKTHDYASAYGFCVRKFLSMEVENEANGKVERVPLAPFDKTGLPTFEQFVYWSRKDFDIVVLAKRRLGARVWEMKNKPKTGTATARTLGPTSKYEIDATVLDVYVRSRADRRRLVGRPTLYVVIDVFSRMIVGVYLGLEHPSWVGAMMALANAVEDKVAFCKRFGIEIDGEDWPARHLCGVLHGDRGELEGTGIEAALDLFNVTVEIDAAYRADWKGVIETRFRLIQVKFAPYVEGYVDTDFRRRGARDYREDAVLDLDDVTQIVLGLVLYHNNHHELKDYPLHKGQVEDEVLSIPAELWRWGIANRSGSGREPNVDRFKFALMPRSQATATPEGLLFQGRHYTCGKAIREGWFSSARNGRFKVPVSHDKRDVDRIYVHDKSELGFDVATLTERHSAHAGLSGWESAALLQDKATMSANHRDKQALALAQVGADMVRVGVRARAELEALPPPLGGLRTQISGARAARALETAVDRATEAADYRPTGPMPTVEPAVIVPIRPDVGREDVSEPSMREIMARLRKEGHV